MTVLSKVKILADTNLLVRAIVDEDPRQTPAAFDILERSGVVVLSGPALCELVWALSRGYRLGGPDIAMGLRTLLAGDNVLADRPMVAAGLALLDAGGDFADGVIAYDGRRLGAETFVSFDRKAIRLLEAQGESTQFLG